ncbi:hypothetical protein Moror_15649 [Moniliophthora roreri MCA 2997]|uniref:Uncharacterized protein n=1 Tax=Moniliophthora roreri (strain MCA 2997) TaxID=1381753 RepID=V2WMT8_MONRO|nr:hypothetical protein Moror_15649 [Moniliophthora roreri MCA 2997]
MAGSTLFAAAAYINKVFYMLWSWAWAVWIRLLLKAGIASRAVKAYPWLFAGYHNTSQKDLLWAAFNTSQPIAFTLLYFLSPAIVSRGALHSLAALASAIWCNMTAA